MATDAVEFLYKDLARPVLWRLNPDLSHKIGKGLYKNFGFIFSLFEDLLYVDDPRLETEMFGHQMTDPLVLAAGWNKNGEVTESMIRSGFRNMVLGSVRPNRHFGNSTPWFDRNVKEKEFYNSMGLPSEGKEYVAFELGKLWPNLKEKITLVVSYAGNSVEEILEVDKYLNNLCHIREINASCPNTADGKFFEQNPELLKQTLSYLDDQKRMPTFVKISPDYISGKEKELSDIIKVCEDTNTGIDSANTRISYNKKLKRNAGLSGPKLFEPTKKQVKFIYGKTQGQIPIIGTGGVETGHQAYELLGYGANAVGLLSVLFSRGPSAPHNINSELIERLDKGPYHSVEELRGKLAN